jgi:tetraacyldisaccharide 4'-kinase
MRHHELSYPSSFILDSDMRHWQRVTLLSALLYPVSLLFRAIVAVRRGAYRRGVLGSTRVAAPVIIVGNISVGGAGKTPLTLWLAEFLSRHGRRPGIVSRGYGGTIAGPQAVAAHDDPARVGDEPLLLARRSPCPVWIGRDRVAAARSLLEANPACDTLLSDDGLQHYRLQRDVELIVIDGERGLGNEWMLPAGPLREPASRLHEADAVVVNGEPHRSDLHPHTFAMRIEGATFHNLRDPRRVVGPEYFRGRAMHAMAGIGHPPRFFAHLRSLGIAFEAHAFPDHHAFTPRDVAFAGAEAILMTEKDAVKCAAFASDECWALRVDAVPDAALGAFVLDRLRRGSA